MLTPEQLAAGRRLHGLARGGESTAIERVEWRIWVDDHVTALLDMAEKCSRYDNIRFGTTFDPRRMTVADVRELVPDGSKFAESYDAAIDAARELLDD